MASDTICAIATSPGMGATALIRVSGKNAFNLVGKLLSDASKFNGTPPNRAQLYNLYYTTQRDGNTSNRGILDQTVITKFAAPHSFTGEDVVEISCHGSVYIQRKIIELLIENGCRLAEPGEFTQRAFLHGKLDLPQAEAIADMVLAQTEASHDIAVRQLQGNLSKHFSTLRGELMQLSSLLELELDFSEEDVQFADRNTLLSIIDNLDNEVSVMLEGYKWGNTIKHGVAVAIVGKPNTGKSTLMNAIIERDRAIVSDIPGTTRDTIEDTFVIDGVLFRFIDTAGIRQSSDKIEMLGVERTYITISNADVVLYVFDANIPDSLLSVEIGEFHNSADVADKKVILVANKADKLNNGAVCRNDAIPISAKYGTNLASVVNALKDFVSQNNSSLNLSLVCNERHYYHLKSISSLVAETRKGIQDGKTTDLVAEDVRTMLHHIGEITGEVTTDDILDNIFSNFCIGK